MNAAHVRAEAAITTRSGFTVDLVAIASHPMVSNVRTASGVSGDGRVGRPDRAPYSDHVAQPGKGQV
jgi:hypothetical protein